MLAHAVENDVRAGWVLGDSVYGCDRSLRLWLARHRQPFVLEVRSSERVWVIAGAQRQRCTVAQAAADLPADSWQRHSAGDGSKGPRSYDWAWLAVAGLRQDDWGQWLLVRRSLSDPTECAYFLVAGPAATTLEEAVPVAGRRWRIERCFEEAKGEAGLDEWSYPALVDSSALGVEDTSFPG
jgi:SRSO17 transposase